ncbi:hypothetical protein Bca4012_009369 [Brassica carinata]|uniref:AAA+ ATPase domain-containing protein n=1 Tax=Brassica carinata TaxID=52824 RepID=A0A8X7S3N0_BRACI|nr:hypothetical protein Bca52824_034637 [Brassica carinata]
MARRGRGGFGGINQRELTDDIVYHLRSTSRRYERLSQNVLLMNVRKILKSSKRLKEEEEDDNSGDQGKRKKQRERSVSSSEEDTGDVSTSEDAEKLSPRFDLINNSLRDSYAKLNTSSEKPIVEVENVTNKERKVEPSIVFIDEIDAIGSKRENQQREMEKRIVTQLLTCMDGPRNKDHDSSSTGYVLVIGATKRPDALDPALRRSGRFECEIALSVPDEDARAEILSVVVQKLRVEGSVDLRRIARLTPGFVEAYLEGVANMAGRIGIKRVMDSRKRQLSGDGDLEQLFVRMSDFELTQGSLTREGFSTVPNVTWDDVGGLDHLRRELNNYIVRPIRHPEIYKAFEANLETGFLLYGPPGCGKTLVAKAVANEAGANFIYIKGPEVLNKYVGEAELAIRTLFQRARTCSPCILFFDEVFECCFTQVLLIKWILFGVSQFLTELDGGERRNVYVTGATNRPDVIDSAFLRPGRFGNLVYVPLPTADERASILKAIAKRKPLDPSVDLDAIAKMNCEGFSGADLANLMDKAIHLAVEERFQSIELSEGDDVIGSSECTIKATHTHQAVSLVSPSVNKQQIKHYEELPNKLQRSGRRNNEQATMRPSFAFE